MVCKAMRESSERAAAVGITVTRQRSFSGIAGVLVVPLHGVVAPRLTHWTTSAEPAIIDVLRGVFEEIVNEDVTVLITKQNVQFALDLAERGNIIENGRNVWDGTIEELREREDLLTEYLAVSPAEVE
jgi:uncharacterized membrane protein